MGVNFLEIASAGSFVDIAVPTRTRQIFITSKDFSSDFYIRKKGETIEKFVPKEAEYLTPELPKGVFLNSDEIFQIKGTGDFTVEYLE
jgi:hypothetical protein